MRRPLLVLLLAAAACATGRGAASRQAPAELSFPPDEIEVAEEELELVGRNDEELFAIGTAALGSGELVRAARAFSRLADLHPSSPHEPAALLNAGLALARLEEWGLALERFRTLADRGGGATAVEASFRVAECQYHLGELAEAHRTLDALSRRDDLAAADRVRALTQRGVVELEEGRPDEAEGTLRLALDTYRAASEHERLDDGFAAQAQFYLGEVYRGWFRALPLDPSTGDEEALRRDLEHKADVLLSAQGHYLRAIRMGSDRWAIASGYRIGELYEELRAQLLDAPLPPGLQAEQAAAYREELRRQVRVLAAKAITAYEQTLARAARAGVEDLRFLADAEGALERLKRAIAENAPPPGT